MKSISPSEATNQESGVLNSPMAGSVRTLVRRMCSARTMPADLPPSLPVPWLGPKTRGRRRPKSWTERCSRAMRMNGRRSLRKRRTSAIRACRSSAADRACSFSRVERQKRLTISLISTSEISRFSVATMKKPSLSCRIHCLTRAVSSASGRASEAIQRASSKTLSRRSTFCLGWGWFSSPSSSARP